MRHIVIRSKMKKTQPLIDDPIISRHVPETDWFSTGLLRKMLRSYSTVYIKPDVGRKGYGVIRVRKLDDSKCEIANERTFTKCAANNVVSELNKIMNDEKAYIIQRGIDLATYNNRPFDLRVVLHRPLSRWHLSWMSAKVAPRKSSVVTNVAQGAKDVSLWRVLRGIDQRVNVYQVLHQLIDVSYQTAQILGSKFPFNIIGLDMGIDRQGDIWFIEANTKPDSRGLKELDPDQWEKYQTAKRLIDNG